jgi:hypothetical protein
MEKKEMDRYITMAVDKFSPNERQVCDPLFVRERPPEKVATELAISMNVMCSRKNRINACVRKEVKIPQEKG